MPACLVKIGCQEETGFIQQHRIDTHDEIAAVTILARKMLANHLIGNGKKLAMLAAPAFDSGFLAHAGDPFVGTGRGVTGPTGPLTLEAACVNILSSTK